MPFKVRSKYTPYPARIAVFPFPIGSQAKPTRGPKLLFEFGLTRFPYGEQVTPGEMAFAPAHAFVGKMIPFVYVAGIAACPATKSPVAGSIAGASAGL